MRQYLLWCSMPTTPTENLPSPSSKVLYDADYTYLGTLLYVSVRSVYSKHLKSHLFRRVHTPTVLEQSGKGINYSM